MTKIENPAKFMHESGLLYAVNRQILHPLGLALYYSETEAGEIIVQGLGVVETENGEPFDFEPARVQDAERRLAAFLAKRKTGK